MILSPTTSVVPLAIISAWERDFDSLFEDEAELTPIDNYCDIHHEQYEPGGSCTQCEAEDHDR